MMIELIECSIEAPRRAKITIKEIPSWLSRLFGAREQTRSYVGWCTVWHELPNFRRADALREETLCDVWAELKWEQGI